MGVRVCEMVDDHDLLPEFAAEAVGEGFDFVDGVEDGPVVTILRKE